MKAREECDKRHMDMDLGENVIEKGLGGLAVGGLGGEGVPGKYGKWTGIAKEKGSCLAVACASGESLACAETSRDFTSG